jgi:type II secretory pathway component PulK
MTPPHLRIDRRRPRHAYALLLVLFVIALAATAMAAVCRMSLEKSMQASRAQADLQRRWALLTCRSVLLPKAEAIIARSKASTSQVAREIHLNGQPLTLIFGDEQAKANVNLLYAQGGLSGAEREVRAVVEASNASMAVELRPIPGRGKSFGTSDASDDDPPAFEGFAQVFAAQQAMPASLLTAGRGTAPPVAALLTCWGDGSLNLRRASADAVRAVLSRRLAAGEITRLLDLRAKNPDLESSDLLDALALSEPRREAVEDLLTSESSCHSLWIVSATGTRYWYDLAVSDGGGGVNDALLLGW